MLEEAVNKQEYCWRSQVLGRLLVRQQLPLLLEKSAQSVSQCTRMQGVLLLLEEGVNAGAQCWCWSISLL